MEHRCRSVAHPSLAVVKYWGKRDGGINLPAVPSVAVTLAELQSTCDVVLDTGSSRPDRIVVNDEDQEPVHFEPLLDAVRAAAGVSGRFAVHGHNSFPTAAGLASSSSGMAALAAAALGAAFDASLSADRAVSPPVDRAVISRIARLGSGSAARAVYGGFTRWDAGAETARRIHDEAWWPEFRVVVVPVVRGKKPISSRTAMERTRRTSPYYDAWIADAPLLADVAENAIGNRDLRRLGETARLSYLRMFATMFSADPPVQYWLPASVEAQIRLAALRNGGVAAWETMDAGPQIKVLTSQEAVPAVIDALQDLSDGNVLVCSPGPGVSVECPGHAP